MSLVLTTQIGFVTKVEHAPAVIEAIVRASHLFSVGAACQRCPRELAEQYLPIRSFNRSLVDS
jgi:hypothetical protein